MEEKRADDDDDLESEIQKKLLFQTEKMMMTASPPAVQSIYLHDFDKLLNCTSHWSSSRGCPNEPAMAAQYSFSSYQKSDLKNFATKFAKTRKYKTH
jgi:hypothetical protein